MVYLKAEIEKFDVKGEKTGWSYVFIPQAVAHQIKPSTKKSFRLKGKIDQIEFTGMGILPMGDGDFIMAIKKPLRVQLKKELGDTVELWLAHDADFKVEMPEDLELCLAQEDGLLTTFLSQPKSHQVYFINWLNSAKTEVTRTKRIVSILDAMAKKYDFGEMIRSGKS